MGKVQVRLFQTSTDSAGRTKLSLVFPSNAPYSERSRKPKIAGIGGESLAAHMASWFGTGVEANIMLASFVVSTAIHKRSGEVTAA